MCKTIQATDLFPQSSSHRPKPAGKQPDVRHAPSPAPGTRDGPPQSIIRHYTTQPAHTHQGKDITRPARPAEGRPRPPRGHPVGRDRSSGELFRSPGGIYSDEVRMWCPARAAAMTSCSVKRGKDALAPGPGQDDDAAELVQVAVSEAWTTPPCVQSMVITTWPGSWAGVVTIQVWSAFAAGPVPVDAPNLTEVGTPGVRYQSGPVWGCRRVQAGSE